MKSILRLVAGAAVAAAVLVVPDVTLAQRGGGGGGGGFRGGFGGPMGGDGILGLLQRDEIRQEIQLVDEQQEQLESVLNEVRDEMRNEMQGMFGQMRDLSEEERRARFDEIRTRMEAMSTDVEGRIQKVLLPHQFERLKQIDVQSRVQRQGAAALTSGELAQTLGLSDAQQEQLRQRSVEVQRELDEQIRQLRLEARSKLLDVLTAEQRAKLDSLMGEQFSMPEQRFGGGRFGERGGRGPGGRGPGGGGR